MRQHDAAIIGAGHNGLVAAAYLARAGLDVVVLERRHCIGGAAVTEELYPGFRYSRASYLAGLLRPHIIADLDLHAHGLSFLARDPSSVTPTRDGRALALGSDANETHASISQYSTRDADCFAAYEETLTGIRSLVAPLLDGAPPTLYQGGWREKAHTLALVSKLVQASLARPSAPTALYELFTSPASRILDRWFESQILKTTLATDAVIGAMTPPSQTGSGYVLLHHVMGETNGQAGVWSYVQGGMGAVSASIRSAAEAAGARVVTDAVVSKIVVEEQRCTGVEMQDGTLVKAKTVLSNATPFHTFTHLLPSSVSWPSLDAVRHHVRHTDYSCGAFKINCALASLPQFPSFPSTNYARATIHFEEEIDQIEAAAAAAVQGRIPDRPVIEMTIPSSLDSTIAPDGKHVCQLFVQFIPYHLQSGSWSDPSLKERVADRVFGIIDEYAPGFSSLVLHRDILSPLDLERVFGLHQGNIFHGALALHQLGYTRPVPGWSSYRSPVPGLYLCGAGSHPGGGVMGASGHNCAQTVLWDIK